MVRTLVAVEVRRICERVVIRVVIASLLQGAAVALPAIVGPALLVETEAILRVQVVLSVHRIFLVEELGLLVWEQPMINIVNTITLEASDMVGPLV